MRIKTLQAEKLRKIFETIANIVDEVTLKIEKDGIKIRAMDPGHIALVDFEMKKDAFDEYNIKEAVSLGLDLKPLVNVLKRIEENVTLELKEAKTTLMVSSEGLVKKKFEIPLIELAEEPLKIPTLKFEAEAEISGDMLKNAISDASVFGEQVSIKADSSSLSFIAKSDESEAETRIEKDNCISFSSSVKEAKSTFTLEYLADISKIADIVSQVKLFIGTNIPLKLEFSDEHAKIVFFLAPRIAE